MTVEQKAAKIEELKARIAERRAQRELEEKSTKTQSEIQRREMGKQMNAAREEYEKIQRDIAYAKRKKEKEDTIRERERLRAEIAKDKAERRARGGKVRGGIGEPLSGAPVPEKPKEPVKVLTPEEKLDQSIEKLKKYRVAGDGLVAVKTLNVYVKNLIEKPDEAKFREINLNNAAFKKRVASLVGGIGVLLALGYKKNEETSTLNLSVEDRNESFLRLAQTKLQAAINDLSQS